MFVKYNNKDLYNTCLKMIEAYKKQMNIYKDCFLEIFKYEDFIKDKLNDGGNKEKYLVY